MFSRAPLLLILVVLALGLSAPGAGAEITSLLVGDDTACVIQNGDLKCWGNNVFGQAGDPTTVGSHSASAKKVVFGSNADVVQADVQGEHTCALLADETVWCFGANGAGELGVPASADRVVPVQINLAGMGTPKKVAVSDTGTCVLFTAGDVRCLGSPGITITGGSTAVPTPINFSGGVVIKDIALGRLHACVITTTSAQLCWGSNHRGELAVAGPTAVTYGVTAPDQAASVAMIDAGVLLTCRVTTAGAGECFGYNAFGQTTSSADLGDPYAGTSTPQVVPELPGDPIVRISAGINGCSLHQSGTVRCWGSNMHGELGDLTGGYGPAPKVINFGEPARQVGAGYFYACALLESGVVKCLGTNTVGQLGAEQNLGTFNSTEVPQLVRGLDEPAPVDPPVETPTSPVQCLSSGVTISGMKLKGRQLEITGFARSEHIGKQVTIDFMPKRGKVIGRGSVALDGTFKVRVSAPAKKLRKRASTRYRASVDEEHGEWVKFDRRFSANSASFKDGTLTIAGKLTAPLGKKLKVVTSIRTACDGAWRSLSSATVSRRGAFSAKLPLTRPASGVILVRFSASVPKSAKSKSRIKAWSFMMPVTAG